jgi:hypothetical protein
VVWPVDATSSLRCPALEKHWPDSIGLSGLKIYMIYDRVI